MGKSRLHFHDVIDVDEYQKWNFLLKVCSKTRNVDANIPPKESLIGIKILVVVDGKKVYFQMINFWM